MKDGGDYSVRDAVQVSGLWIWVEGVPCPELGTQKEQAWGTGNLGPIRDQWNLQCLGATRRTSLDT